MQTHEYKWELCDCATGAYLCLLKHADIGWRLKTILQQPTHDGEQEFHVIMEREIQPVPREIE